MAPTVQRILASAIILVSVLFAPFWLTVILALAGMIYFSNFWEATLLFFLSDLLYGAPTAKLGNVLFVSFVSSIIVLIVLELIKKKLKFYPNKEYR